MNKGTVKWFNAKNGYGFIKNENGTDIFVHYSGILFDKEFRKLHDGQGVEYDIIETEKGIQAVNVIVVEPMAEIIVEEE